MRRCSGCGKKVSGGDSFCPDCGFNLKKRRIRNYIFVGIVVIFLLMGISMISYSKTSVRTMPLPKSDVELQIPNYEVKEQCLIGQGYACTEFEVRSDGSASMTVQNSAGEELEEVLIFLDNKAAANCNPPNLPIGDLTTCQWIPGTLSTGKPGSVFQSSFRMHYLAGGFQKFKTGHLVVKIE